MSFLINSYTYSVAFSAEAQAVFDNISTAGGTLTASEKTAMAKFIDAEVANGNWSLIDEIQFYGLGDSTAKRAGWFGVGNATGGTDETGGISTGSTIVDTNITPSALTNYAQNDSMTQIYCLANTSTSTNDYAFRTALSGSRIALFQNPTTDLRFFHNSTGLSTYTTINTFQDQEYYGILRDASTDMDFHINGSLAIQRNITSSGVPNNDILVGAGLTTATWSFLMIGARIGFDNSAHYTNLNTLLTDLSII